MPSYEKTYSEIVHDEVRDAILHSKLCTIEQRFSFKLSSNLINRYNDTFSSESVAKVHKFRCKKFFEDYYKPLLWDTRFNFQLFNINGVKNIGVFASRDIFCNDDLIVVSFKGYRGRHVSEVEATLRNSVYKATLFAKGKSCKNKRRLEQCYVLLGSLSFINHACEEHANCEPCNHEVRGEKRFHRQSFTQIKAKRALKKGEEILISYGSEEDLIELGYKCYICQKNLLLNVSKKRTV